MDSHTTKDVSAWQNEMLAYRNEENKPYSSSYLKTLHNQDYIIAWLLQKEIIVHGNPRVYKALRERMEAMQNELRRIETGQSPSLEPLEEIDMMTTMMK